MSLTSHKVTGRLKKDQATKTVTIRQNEYILQKDSIVLGYHHIIYAGTVRIKKGVKNPGCNLTIYAAQLIIDEAGGSIDLSGVAGKAYKAGDRSETNAIGYKSGTHDGTNGKNGKAGGKGQNGGSVTINAGIITGGKLEIISNGGDAGRGQDGGNGVNGEIPPAQGDPAMPKKIKTGTKLVYVSGGVTKTVNVYAWGKNVLEIGKSGNYKLLVTKSSKVGSRGGHGGNAGIAGKSGNAGNAGTVIINSLTNNNIQLLPSLIAGKLATNAQFGKPGTAAIGGRGAFFLYKASVGFIDINWSRYNRHDDWDRHWSNGVHITNFKVNSKYVVTKNSKKSLKLREVTGKKGKNGGYGATGLTSKPAIPTAVKGENGSVSKGLLSKPEQFKSISHSYILMLQRSASIALVNRNQKLATPLLHWLMFLTSTYKNIGTNASAEARERQLIYQESENALYTMDKNLDITVIKSEAKRCIHRDIKLYSDFVETSLLHVENQSKYFHEFQQQERTKAQQIKTLKNAISETKEHILLIVGSDLKPGGIDHFRETERQLKSSLGDLDLQLLDYRQQLTHMPTNLQNEVDTKYFEETQISLWDLLDYFSMAAGIIINFASAASSIVTMINKAKDFYLELLELSSWAEILKDGLWNRNFMDIKSDISTLMEGKEWKGVKDDSKKFIGSVVDFQAKIAAYEKLLNSRADIDFGFDIMDIQASILIFDVAKLKLIKQRNQLENSLRDFLDDYEAAKDWKYIFTDFFDTSITRFNMLAHLADNQAERRQLEYQKSLCERNIKTMQEELNLLQANTTNTDYAASRDSMENNLYLAINQGLERVMDEYRAYQIWALSDTAIAKIGQDLSARLLRSKYHEKIWELINLRLGNINKPSTKDKKASPFKLELRETGLDFKETYFDKNSGSWRFIITLPLNLRSNIYFQQLTDIKVHLKGASVAKGSEFHCILRHSGISRFLDKNRQEVLAYQNKRSIELSYIIENGMPKYDYSGAIKSTFDDQLHWKQRIYYSPFTTWEIEIIPNYQQDTDSLVYNKDIDWSGFTEIEFPYKVFYQSFKV
jgi:hypothetical protein